MLKRFPPAPLGPANNPMELWEMQIEVNKRHNMQFHFFGHMVVDGKLWCWYEIRESDFRLAEQEDNGAE